MARRNDDYKKQRGPRFAEGTVPLPSNKLSPVAHMQMDDFAKIRKLWHEECNANILYKYVMRCCKDSPGMDNGLCYTAVKAYAWSGVPREYLDLYTRKKSEVVKMQPDFLYLYADFNAKLRRIRQVSSWKSFPYQSFYYLLYNAKKFINVPSIKSSLYRGLKNFRYRDGSVPVIGDVFYFHCFTSTSTDLNVIMEFMEDDEGVPRGTIIKIEDGASEAIAIAEHSYFPDEKEVVVFPRNKFQVLRFQRDVFLNVDALTLRQIGVI